MRRCLALLALLALVHADVYMHSPRGSNDRNCEKNVNRNNGNRLFDSQNNAKGGYACPRPRVGPQAVVDTMYHHVGSKVVVEWTNQHGCGTNPKTGCEIVLQYACEDTLDPAKRYRGGENIGAPRDGTPADANDAATDRIPETEEAARADNTKSRRYGMHENNEFYQKCKQRSRNKGLYTADQQVRRAGSIGTRQNPNGNRRGLECPEERDYYPYWAPNPWRDIAVITSNPQRCAYYKSASQNKVARGECIAAEDFYAKDHVYTSKCRMSTGVNRDDKTATNRKARQEWFNNKEQCEGVGHKWAPTWFDLRHEDSKKAQDKMRTMKASVVGNMNLEVFDALSPAMLCNTKANLALEKSAASESIKLEAASFETSKQGVEFVKADGDSPAHVVVNKKAAIWTKEDFKAPIKVEFKFLQIGAKVECIRSWVFPQLNANGPTGGNQFGMQGWPRSGVSYPFVQIRKARQTKIDAKNSTYQEAGCYVKHPTGCPRNAKIKYQEWSRDRSGDGDADKCTKRIAAWNSYCNIKDAEAKWVALPESAKVEQVVEVEVDIEMNAKFTLNGKQVWQGKIPDMQGPLGFGLSCADAKLTSLKVFRPGMYGITTQGCADKLREAVTGKSRVPHSYSSTFSGKAEDCGATEALRPCVNRLCPEAKSLAPKVERLSGYFVPTKTGSFTFALKAAYGAELWLDEEALATNKNKNAATATGKTKQLKAGQAYKLQAFGAAVTEQTAGCYVRVPGGCSNKKYLTEYGAPEEWSRDYYAERSRGAFANEQKCLARKREFDGFCKVTTAEMKFKSPAVEPVLQLWVNKQPMSTASETYRVCADSKCSDAPAKQTQATATCKCDSWATRAPKEWAFTDATPSVCMRPVYDPKTGPWCYCVGKKPDFALCDPKLAPNKGIVNLEQSPEEWSETSPAARRLLAAIEEDSAQAVAEAGVELDCVDGRNSMSRENQLGNARNTANPDPAIPHGLNANRYIWTVPDTARDNCVIRLRYNISTSDYPAWSNDGTPMTTSKQNARRTGQGTYVGPDGKPTTSPIAQDPYIGIGPTPDKTFLSLAVNTNQYGRTFQDRSYVFHIKPRPAGIAADAKIYNVNVRGKRGNIVQTYPAVEYDFVPNDLCVQTNDYVHFQWTGSDYNPQRNPNDAEGAGDLTDTNQASRADRSNLVELDDTPAAAITSPASPGKGGQGQEPRSVNQNGAGRRVGEVASGMNYPAGTLSHYVDGKPKDYKGMFVAKDGTADTTTIMNLAFIKQVERLRAKNLRCSTLEELEAIPKQNNRERSPGNCAKLNGAHEPYFDAGLVQMRKAGRFPYFSSRNNNFSNRNQAGFMCVGKGTCGKIGCQATVENELLDRMKRGENADGTAKNGFSPKLVELDAPPEECDAKCVAELRALVQKLQSSNP